MRELVATLEFYSPCLGGVKKFTSQQPPQPYFVLSRNETTGRVMFKPQSWLAGFETAANVLCRHQSAVRQILPQPDVIGQPRPITEECVRRRSGKRRQVEYEAFFPGQTIQVTFVVPDAISDDDFRQLLVYLGKYSGLSPGLPRRSGFFTVQAVQPLSHTEELTHSCE